MNYKEKLQEIVSDLMPDFNRVRISANNAEAFANIHNFKIDWQTGKVTEISASVSADSELYAKIEKDCVEHKNETPTGVIYAWTYFTAEGARFSSPVCDGNPAVGKRNFINQIIEDLK